MVKLRQCRAKFRSVKPLPRYGDFSIIQDGCRRHLDFYFFWNFNGRTRQKGRTASLCQIWWRSVKSLPILRRFFQDGGRPPSWICYACVRTTHEGHLVVFITMQNLVGIDEVVLIICMFFDFASLAGKRLFTPKKLFFLEFWPHKWGAMSTKPKIAHPCASPRHLSHHARQSVDGSDLYCSEFPKRGHKFLKNGYVSPIRPEAPRGPMCTKFSTAVGVADVITCNNVFVIGWRVSIL